MHSSKHCNQEENRIGLIWLQIRWKMKAMLRETKENVRGTNSDGKETGTQINNAEQKEEINVQPEQNEETRIQKSEERPRNLWDNFLWDNLNRSNIWIIGVPEGEEEDQEIENLLEKSKLRRTSLIWQRK